MTVTMVREIMDHDLGSVIWTEVIWVLSDFNPRDEMTSSFPIMSPY